MVSPKRVKPVAADDLFSTAPEQFSGLRRDELRWPLPHRFPLNVRATVGDSLRRDLITSAEPLVVAGYSSLAHLVDAIGRWLEARHAGVFRLVLGSEPSGGHARLLGPASQRFTAEVADYWLARGFSLAMSSRLLAVIDAAETGRVSARIVPGGSRLHAKVYIGDDAATVGSSNFTEPGLRSQYEANARFARLDDQDRYVELAQIGTNFWQLGEDWTSELARLLRQLLQLVSWEEALARAAADLLDGGWAGKYVAGAQTTRLWPSQRRGIAQALWVIDNVGGVLIADATGSGKTRMGAHLLKAVLDRMWMRGRLPADHPVLVCPPGVMEAWNREVFATGLPLRAHSHGGLSAVGNSGDDVGVNDAVQVATILALDEAHNFLNRSARTQRIMTNRAEHVVLFTATPISRGAKDLLSLVALLGPDNFSDDTVAALRRLERKHSADLTPEELATIRAEIQRFAVRRTKAQLNDEVDREPAAYRDADSGRVNRYPVHVPETYKTGETPADSAVANEIVALTRELRGLVLLEKRIAVPPRWRRRHTPEQWRDFRLAAVKGLAAHQVLSAMRSSRAAAVEHVAGTARARTTFDALAPAGPDRSAGAIDRLRDKPMPILEADVGVADWLGSETAWEAAVGEELALYDGILSRLLTLSDAREQTKAALLTRLAADHALVLAFDHHLITLDVVSSLLPPGPPEVVVATGQSGNRSKLTNMLRPGSDKRAIALCSDAMNEGLNLQGASVVVHLDLPTTVRVAEQRVGRVDRMNSSHDAIHAYWPDDGPAFATRANDLLASRLEESAALLGSNLQVPALEGFTERAQFSDDSLVNVSEHIDKLNDAETVDWDELHDALSPVRQLVEGSDALISADVYERYRAISSRVMARVATVRTDTPWAFLAVKTPSDVPRWLYVDDDGVQTDLAAIVVSVRRRLAPNPASRQLDDAAQRHLIAFLELASHAEHELLPQKLRRALNQVGTVARRGIARSSDIEVSLRWRAILDIATGVEAETGQVDRRVVAERWVQYVAPRMAEMRAETRQRFVLLRDIDRLLDAEPPALEEVEGLLSGIQVVPSLDERIVACILGCP